MIRSSLLFVRNVLVRMVLALCAVGASAQPLGSGYAFSNNIPYVPGGGDRQQLQIHFPTNGSGLSPLVVFIHGGGWRTGNRQNPDALALTNHARYAVASINYTLSTTEPFPAQIRDAKSAIRWLRANAATFRIDPDRIGLWGRSAGGNLAALLGTTGGRTNFGGTANAEVSDAVQAVFSAAGPTDLRLYGASAPGDDLTLYLGDLVQNAPASLAASNPSNHITAATPPFCFIHSTNDTVVPPAHSFSLHTALTNAGLSSRTTFVPNFGHVPQGAEFVQIAHNFFADKLGLRSELLRGSLLVSAFNSHQVLEVNPADGTLIRVLVQGYYPFNAHGGLNWPHQSVIAPDGTILVASAGNDRVLRFDLRSGAYLGDLISAGAGGLDYPAGMTLGPDGMLYISSQLNDRILRCHPITGAGLATFAGPNAALLDGPSGLAFGPDGNLYVAGRFNYTVVRYNGTNGAPIETFVSSGLSQPFGIAFNRDGQLLVASGNDNEVRLFDGISGAFLRPYATVMGLPVGIAVQPDNTVIAASFNQDQIVRIDPPGTASRPPFNASTNGLPDGPNFITVVPAPSVRPVLNSAVESPSAIRLRWDSGFGQCTVESAGHVEGPWGTATNQPRLLGTNFEVRLQTGPTNSFHRLRTQ